MKKIILASNSKRRQELLKYIVDDFEIIVPSIDEENILKNTLGLNLSNLEKFSLACDRISLKKCEEIAKNNFDRVIITADTIVYDENKIFGKPKDKNDAVFILEYLSGKNHIVQTSVTIFENGKFHTFCEKTVVIFNELDDFQRKLILNYIENEKPFDKAGAYGIQDSGSLLIKEIQGDFFNVVGLPISKLNRKLRELKLS